MSLIFATQLTAVATLALAVLALLAAVLAGLAFWKQSQEVGLLLEQNRNEKAERRRAQASQVSLWADSPNLAAAYIPVHLKNNSPQQLYYPRFGWDLNGQLADLVLYSAADFLPGDTIDVKLPLPTVGTAGVAYRPAAVFRDRAGIWWCLRNDGRLDDLSKLPQSEIDALLHPPSARHVQRAADEHPGNDLTKGPGTVAGVLVALVLIIFCRARTRRRSPAGSSSRRRPPSG